MRTTGKYVNDMQFLKARNDFSNIDVSCVADYKRLKSMFSENIEIIFFK